MPVAIIDGPAIGWGNIEFVLFGNPVRQITKIEFKHSQTKENLYGSGYEPIHRGYGKVEYTGSIELYIDEWKRIIAASPERNPLKIKPFDITIVYTVKNTNIPTGQVDILRECEFTESNMSTASGDTKILVSVPLIIGGIDR
ncbi:MAG: hypothetical protein BWY74_01124 [Firmicutes bacterium ADurb.Bin419]|nr:MAG: hypothetical protein BWY74_01124 [Firmicutes bacterium ADurb.Bin419]